MSAPEVIALFGPTGVGKTAVALALAERVRTRGEDPVAVSADALQVYRGLEKLTGAPSPEEQARLEHRLVSFVDVDRSFSAGEFAALAHDEVDRALEAGRRPIVVGGTGLYLGAALSELDLRPPPEAGLRERLETRLAAQGPEELHRELAERAPTAAAAVDPADRSRIVRALELLEMGEEPAPAADESRLWTAEPRHRTLLCGLVMERRALYEAIDARVEAMLVDGAREQVLRAEQAGASPTARKALGFEELLEDDVEGMKRRTRNYAKRQLTWLRKLRDVYAIDVTATDPARVAARIDRLATGQ